MISTRVSQQGKTDSVFGGECAVEFHRCTLPLGVLPSFVVIFPGERDIRPRWDTQGRSQNDVDILHELLLLCAKCRLHLHQWQCCIGTKAGRKCTKGEDMLTELGHQERVDGTGSTRAVCLGVHRLRNEAVGLRSQAGEKSNTRT